MSDLHGYDNKGVIKSGTFGTVFKVVRKADGVAFAMKVQRCTSEAESLLCKREVQHMQKLSHAGLVPCLEHFERQTEYQEPAHHIIMPLYTGDLEEYITENGPLTEEIMGRLLWDVGSALHYLHQEGCLHRDVKPQNIMRDAQLDRFVLGDLGLMKDTTHSIASSLVGTPGFLAPEFLAQSHNAAYDSKVDMWALGVTACYAGLRPYEQDKLFRYLHLNYEFIMKELRPLLQDRIGHTLQHPVLCMMRKEAAHRMSAGELLHHVGARLRDSVAGLTKEREAARVALNAAEEKIRQLEGIKLLEKEARASSPPLVGTSEKQQNQLEDSVSQISGTPPPSHVEPSAAPLENLSPVEEQGSYKDGWEVLSTLGMDVEKHKNGYKAAPLSVAVENDHEEAIRQLCSNQTIDINAPGLGGYTVLHTAVQKGSKSIVDILLSFKADPDKVTDFGWTALHLAAQRGMFQVVDVLLRSKANPNKRDKYGETPLHVASKHGSVPVVDRLMDSSADPNLQNNPNGWTPLHHAAYEGHASIAEAMRWCKAASMKDNHGRLPSDIAKRHDRTAVLQVLNGKEVKE
eukprot:TRINITY_DN484_c2_g1_i2.p1 TRINITY_DN484_c2_g1~~TRINITY_DN484_c2_g1_i2.p1  ORF type:complete len:573 (+),score=167.06 TRINITY_DN484_c2_g1_i2:113-1831(+)